MLTTNYHLTFLWYESYCVMRRVTFLWYESYCVMRSVGHVNLSEKERHNLDIRFWRKNCKLWNIRKMKWGKEKKRNWQASFIENNFSTKSVTRIPWSLSVYLNIIFYNLFSSNLLFCIVSSASNLFPQRILYGLFGFIFERRFLLWVNKKIDKKITNKCYIQHS